MAELILFGSIGCHLCEEAKKLLLDAELEFELKEIMDNEVWQDKYGLLIPVLQHELSQSQLNWPFDIDQVRAFIP